MTATEGRLWTVRLRTPKAAAAAYADALAGHCDSVSWTAADGEPGSVIEGLASVRPQTGILRRLVACVAEALGDPAPAFHVGALAGRDWLAENRRAFPPLRAGRYWIRGSHVHRPAPPGAIAITLDAATAFGSGQHGSTRGCLIALDDLARRHRPRSALDLGCGSGILAIAMARTWKVPVVAADIDPESVRVAQANLRRNGVTALARVVTSDGFRAAAIRHAGPFDLIVANLLAGPLIRLAGGIGRALAEGGTAVLSGLAKADWAGVAMACRSHGLVLRRTIAVEGWHTLVLGRAGGWSGAASHTPAAGSRGRNHAV